MKKTITLLFISLSILSCSNNNDLTTVFYDVTYTVTASNGATINQIEYLDENADRVTLTNVNSPWTINLRIRGGLALEAAAYGDVPYQGELSITANWKLEGDSQTNNESESLPNNQPNSIINNGKVEIEGRTLPRE